MSRSEPLRLPSRTSQSSPGPSNKVIDSLQILRELLSAPVPLLLLVARRNDHTSLLQAFQALCEAAGDRFVDMSLGPLSLSETDDMLRTMNAGKRRSTATVRAVRLGRRLHQTEVEPKPCVCDPSGHGERAHVHGRMLEGSIRGPPPRDLIDTHRTCPCRIIEPLGSFYR